MIGTLYVTQKMVMKKITILAFFVVLSIDALCGTIMAMVRSRVIAQVM